MIDFRTTSTLTTSKDLRDACDNGEPVNVNAMSFPAAFIFRDVKDEFGWVPPWALRACIVWDAIPEPGFSPYEPWWKLFVHILRWLASREDREQVAAGMQTIVDSVEAVIVLDVEGPLERRAPIAGRVLHFLGGVGWRGASRLFALAQEFEASHGGEWVVQQLVHELETKSVNVTLRGPA